MEKVNKESKIIKTSKLKFIVNFNKLEWSILEFKNFAERCLETCSIKCRAFSNELAGRFLYSFENSFTSVEYLNKNFKLKI